MKSPDNEKLHPFAEAVLQQAVRMHFERDVPPDTLVEKSLDVTEAEAACDQRKSELARCVEAERSLIAQEAEQEARGEQQFADDGLVSTEISIALSALAKSKLKAAAATEAARAALESAKTSLEVRRAIRRKAAIAWAIHSSTGPAKAQEAAIVQMLEFLPMVLLKSALIYEEARSFGWDSWEHPSGPAGALLANLQQLRWPDALRPSWSPRAGPCPTPQQVFAKFSAMLPDRSAVKNRIKELSHVDA